jgi:hypothetical protein
MKYLKYFESTPRERKEQSKKKFEKNMKILFDDENYGSIEDSVKFIIEHCSEWLENPIILQRSMKAKECIFHTKPVKRYSIHNENYYNLILDNDVKWKGYPKRTKSLIGSINISPGFAGKPFYMIPFDGAKFGVAPTSDIITAFREGFSEVLGMVKSNFMYFGIDDFFRNMKITFKDSGIQLSDTNFRVFKSNVNKTKNLRFEIDTLNENIMKKLIEKNGSFYSNLSKCMEPKINGFKLMDVEDLYLNFNNITTIRNEIWTDSECIFIPVTYFDEVMVKIKQFKK